MSGSDACKNSPMRNKHSALGSDKYADITKEEFSRISEAFKKEEFRKLFFDYCEEIQDPKNRELYEKEIVQFEKERGVDVRFINPEPGFVVKTSVDGKLKCFLNISKSKEVARPTNKACLNPETGVRGLNWSIPLAQAPPRDDFDAQKKRCIVYDVIFHPDALYLSQRDEAFRKCLIDTALDAVEREFKVQLDRANLRFPKMEFKGVARPIITRKLSENPPPDASEPHPLDGISPPKPTACSVESKKLPMKSEPLAKPEFNTPKYVVKHRRDVDLAEYTDELDAKLNVTVPRQLVIEIELPLLKSAAECQLDVTPKSLYLLSERSGAKYRLNFDLPYTVDDKNGSARFDTDTRRLCITLPVVQDNAERQRAMHDMLLQLNREDSGVESDIREDATTNSNSESPVEELSDMLEEFVIENSTPDSPVASNQSLTTTELTADTFLKNSIQYQFPTKFDCNVLDNVMSLVLHVRNVSQQSIAILQKPKTVHIQFTSLGTGYYPAYYAFYLQLPDDYGIDISSAEAEAWENNVVLNVNFKASGENLHSYFAGIDVANMKEYNVQGKFQLSSNLRQRKKTPVTPPISLSSSLDISVERSECESSVEIEIKPCETHSTCTANTTEDEDNHNHAIEPVQKKMNKKQKKKNKKRRSLSDSVCDDIKIYQQQQKKHVKYLKEAGPLVEGINKNSSNSPEDNSSPERAETNGSATQSVAVPSSSQQRKLRSYSECRNYTIVSSGESTLPPSFKGILKHYSRYEPRPSISDSCSSIDEYSMYSSSMDGGVGSSLRFSQSFSDIPEENASGGLSESCKKTVRFNEVIKKQVFRLDSSILGQRKKNQKRRDRKQRALQRRHSEGDSADYEDNNTKPIAINTGTMQRHNMNNDLKEDMRGDMENSSMEAADNFINAKHTVKYPKCKKTERQRLESESSTDVDGTKNTMMFEMEM